MLGGYSLTEALVVWAIFLFSAAAKGVTGLGFSTTCLALLALTVGLREGMALLIVPSLTSNVSVMVGAGAFAAVVRRFWPLFVSALPGVALGLWLLASTGRDLPGGVLGAVLVAYCAFALARPGFRLAEVPARRLAPLTGFLTGTINGLTGSQVMPVLPYLMALGLAPNVFVQAINCSFTLSSLAMAAGLSHLGLMTVSSLAIALPGAAIAWWGVRLGERLRRRLRPEAFRIAVLAMLAVLGLTLIGRLL